MYVAELCFPGAGSHDPNTISHSIHRLLSALHHNGQIGGDSWPIIIRNQDVVVTVAIPDQDSLDSAPANQYVQEAMSELPRVKIEEPRITIIGKQIDSDPSCTCAKASSYVLNTNFLSIESPLRCGACFNPVPLYKIPTPAPKDYYDILSWQSDYQACDRLFIGSSTLERATLRERSQLTSSLSQRGIEISGRIFHATDVPVYYYLYRYYARSKKQEHERKCPSCQREWLLETSWHFFDFRCDHCRLVSNIAWDVR